MPACAARLPSCAPAPRQTRSRARMHACIQASFLDAVYMCVVTVLTARDGCGARVLCGNQCAHYVGDHCNRVPSLVPVPVHAQVGYGDEIPSGVLGRVSIVVVTLLSMVLQAVAILAFTDWLRQPGDHPPSQLQEMPPGLVAQYELSPGRARSHAVAV